MYSQPSSSKHSTHTNNETELQEYLLTTLDEQLFFSVLGESLRKHLQVDKIKIYKTFEDASCQLVAETEKEVKDSPILKEGPCSCVFRSGKPYYTNQVKRDPMYKMSSIEGVEAELSFPLEVAGTVIATLHFQSMQKGYLFNDGHIQTVQQFLSQLQAPLANMALYLSAKNMGQTLLKKMEEKEEALQKQARLIPKVSHEKFKELNLIGESTIFKKMLEQVNKIAMTHSPVILQGESGTGKELIARKIHTMSERRNAPYIVVNCGALQESLLESELFGYAKGAFTGAVSNKDGLTQLAHGGTLFLDEVAELTLPMQAKLLRFLQEGEVYALGSHIPCRVDVRIISATNRDLQQMVREGTFREDLYFRLSTFSITSPSLKERKEDIKLLAEHYLNRQGAQNPKVLSAKAIALLEKYDWPGNIRELKNVMERVFVMSENMMVEEVDLPDCLYKENQDVSDSYQIISLADLEKKHIENTMIFTQGNKTKTAKILGITVKTLYNKLHSYNIVQA
ncbi:MAG: sigma 54-interacting transcriptional regulator [Bacteriovoracaceae bacterium]|nr:sigma 54-interacting transcriptional regulator [Bacteriovoracaceae bacterium]